MENSKDKKKYIANIFSLVENGKFKEARKKILRLKDFHFNDDFSYIEKIIKKKELLLERVSVFDREVVHQKCPNCSSPIEIFDKDSKITTCSKCNSDIKINNNILELFKNNFKGHNPRSDFIFLGQIFTFEGVKFQVIGRSSYRYKYQEWDKKYKKYYDEKWSDQEWALVSENQEHIFISKDFDGYYISEKFIPINPSIPDIYKDEYVASFHLEKQNAKIHRIIEKGNIFLKNYEGELSWFPDEKTYIQYSQYKDEDVDYSVEVIKKEDIALEVEFFKTVKIDKIDLLKSAEKSEKIDSFIRIEEDIQKKEKEINFFANIFHIIAVVFFILTISSFVSFVDNIETYTVDASKSINEGILVGPITLEHKNSVYKIELSSSMNDNSLLWSEVELLNEQKESINKLSGDFWRESGYEGGEYWSESYTRESMQFRLENPGIYYLMLYTQNTQGYITLKVYGDIILTRYYFLVMLFSVLYGFSLRLYKRYALHLAFLIIPVILFFIFKERG